LRLSDGLGSTSALTDGSGNVIQTYRSDEFGAPASTQGGVTQDVQYAEEQRDESGYVFLRARTYAPTLGRFLQRDPLVGVPMLPLSLNRYAYAGSNPVSAVDPTGLSSSQVLQQGNQTCLDVGDVNVCVAFPFAPGPGGIAFTPAIAKNLCLFAPELCSESGGGGGGSTSNAKVYRALSPGEDPSLGIWARDPQAENSPISHVAGQQLSQWISTSKDIIVALTKYGGSTNGVVEIDLSKVSNRVVDLSNGIPGVSGVLSNWAKKDQEVLVQG